MVQGKGIRRVPLLDPTAVIPEISRVVGCCWGVVRFYSEFQRCESHENVNVLESNTVCRVVKYTLR